MLWCLPSRDNRRRRSARGNVMVLVTASLALLVLIATGFLTRTRSGRLTAIAHRDVRLADNNAKLIADMIAQEIGQALFVRPIDADPMNGTGDPAVFAGGAADSNYPRLLPWVNASRYGIDPGDDFFNGTGYTAFAAEPADGLKDFPYNFAPYHVVPWTNWPDGFSTGGMGGALNRLIPPGAGNPAPLISPSPIPIQVEENPVGGPGFGDCRWLADVEPMRWDIDVEAPALGNGPGLPDRYSHWRKLPNLSRPGNGWRICRDISNVFIDQPPQDGIFETANVISDLSIPVEQWLAHPLARPDTIQPDYEDAWFQNLAGGFDFGQRWDNWTASLNSYLNTYHEPSRAPTNFYRLTDSNGNGEWLELPPPDGDGERWADTFRPGTVRWNVGRILADADGDGYTDAFWHLVPSMSERGVRQVVAVRIIDNSAMLNFNVATRFVRSDVDPVTGVNEVRKTRGRTPADLALAGDLSDDDYYAPDVVDNIRVGMFDNPYNWETYLGAPSQDTGRNTFFAPGYYPFGDDYVRWARSQWDLHLASIGWIELMAALPGGYFNPNTDDPDILMGPAWERLAYWQKSGRRPFDPAIGLTPFTLGDELELRMYHGNNHSKIHTRFEASVYDRRYTGNNDDWERNDPENDWDLLHSDWVERHETSETQEQLRNRELLFDLRSKLTAYNGARNDIMPPWLWRPAWAPPPNVDLNGNGLVDPGIEAEELAPSFYSQSRRKLDLREDAFYSPSTDADPWNNGELTLAERMPMTLVAALSQTFPDPSPAIDFSGPSYTGDVEMNISGVGNDALTNLRRLAAGYTANMLEYRDTDETVYLDDGIPLPPVHTIPLDQNTQFMGMETQPFLVEAFIGHVYELKEAEYDHEPGLTGEPQVMDGDRVLCANLDQSTIVVVQIANPYDRPITLIEYDEATGDPVPGPGGAHISKFELSVFGQTLDLGHASFMTPAPNLYTFPNPYVLQPEESRTYFSIEYNALGGAGGGPVDRSDWFELLKLDAHDPNDFNAMDRVDLNTWVDLRQDYAGVGGIETAWSTDRSIYDSANENRAIELLRRVYRNPTDPLPPVSVVVDRIDIKPGQVGGESDRFGGRVGGFEQALFDPAVGTLDDCAEPGPAVPPDLFAPFWNVRNFRSGITHLAQVASASRMWRPVDPEIRADERNPRFIFAHRHVDSKARWTYDENDSVNTWFTGSSDDPYIPDFSRRQEDVPEIEDKFDFPMQMCQKDGDFDQIGELLNVWLKGHELNMVQVGLNLWDYTSTETTFSEAMWAEPGDPKRGTNRLRTGELLGRAEEVGFPPYVYPDDPRHFVPALPAGARLMDAFVCDGPGVAPVVDLNGNGPEDELDERRFHNAGDFDGSITPGLINLNTTTREVLRALPNWFRLVHEFNWITPNLHPYVRLPEAVVQYRDRLGMPYDVFDILPGYSDRGRPVADVGDPLNPQRNAPGFPLNVELRGERGFASIGELLLLDRAGKAGKTNPLAGLGIVYGIGAADPDARISILDNSSFQIDYLRVPEREQWVDDGGVMPADPYYPRCFQEEYPPGTGIYQPLTAQVSTDVVNRPDPGYPVTGVSDWVAEDREEDNVLFAGVSNLVTTRSDVFTVYFRVRSFRQNPVTGAWDATDREAIVEENRYVMLVDRSAVNRPSDRPKILYLEQLPPS